MTTILNSSKNSNKIITSRINKYFLDWLNNTIDHLENIKETALKDRDWSDFKSVKIKLDVYKKIRDAVEILLNQSCEVILKFINQEAADLYFDKEIQERRNCYDNLPDCIIKVITINSIQEKYIKIVESVE